MSTLEESNPSAAKEAPKNIVLCFDGTGDWVGFDRTNVAQIFSELLRDKNQLTFYDGGVGTLTNPQALTGPQRTALRLIDLGVATGLREKVLNGYNFLIQNYHPGDRIYMFGFSRGAYTARLVASMVHNFGILRKEHEVLSQYLWQTLESIPPGRDIESQSTIGVFKATANRLKRDFSIKNVKIHFMGLFDTVSSVGILRRFNVYPNTDKNPSILRVCHAVAIDEQRNAFPEALFHPKQPGLTEVWFPGVHRDSGGGLDETKRRIADEALIWVADEAEKKGLLFIDDFVKTKRKEIDEADVTPVLNYPSIDPYVFLGFYPMKMFVKRVTGFRFIWPNFRHLRTIPEDAFVHEIALQLKGYAPANYPLAPRMFPADQTPTGKDFYQLRAKTFSIADLIGTLLCATILFLFWNNYVGNPYKAISWPQVWPETIPGFTAGHATSTLFGLFVASQFIGQKFADKLPKGLRPRAEGILPIVGVLVAIAVGAEAYQMRWVALAYAALPAFVIALASQLPGLPTLPSDRTLPSVLWAVVGSALLCRLVAGITPIWPYLWLTGAAVATLAVLYDVVADRLNQKKNEVEAQEKQAGTKRSHPGGQHTSTPNAAATLATTGIQLTVIAFLVPLICGLFDWKYLADHAGGTAVVLLGGVKGLIFILNRKR